jgi:enoyl-[acyl-carrier protein] reductase I
MIDVSTLPLLKGKKALVTGIANDQSIAWGCAKAFRAFGADLAITYLNDKAKPYVEPLAKEVEASIFMPLNVQVDGQLEAVFDTIAKQWGNLDIVLHSRPKPICKVGWSTARGRAFFSPWTCPAGRSSAWQSSPNR